MYTHFIVTSPATYVAHVQINRPQKLNSFSEPVWREFESIFNRLSHDPDVRAVVLSAVGDRAFSAGLDVQDASNSPLGAGLGGDPSRYATMMRRHIVEFQEAIAAAEKCEKRTLVSKSQSLSLSPRFRCLYTILLLFIWSSVKRKRHSHYMRCIEMR